MIIGVPKEIKPNEGRFALAPAGVAELRKRGHRVLVQADGGTASGFEDAEYEAAGASIVPSAETIWGDAELIVKQGECSGEC